MAINFYLPNALRTSVGSAWKLTSPKRSALCSRSLLKTSFPLVELVSPLLTSAWSISELVAKLLSGTIFEPWGNNVTELKSSGDIDLTGIGNRLEVAALTDGTTGNEDGTSVVMASVLKTEVDRDGVSGNVAMVTDGVIVVVGTVQRALDDIDGPGVVIVLVL
jgi:hypothetical protein